MILGIVDEVDAMKREKTTKALAQKSAEDTISRKAVLEVLTNNGVHFCDMVKITSDIKDLPSIIPQSENQWIHIDFDINKWCEEHGYVLEDKKTLKQSECEDAISRNALMIALMDKGLDHIQADDLTEINQIVEELPSVKPRERSGHWIETDDNASPQCSECGAITYRWKYCPICGSRNGE